jgi:hypothetical protein
MGPHGGIPAPRGDSRTNRKREDGLKHIARMRIDRGRGAS